MATRRLQHSSLTTQAEDAIRAMIVQGDLQLGEPISEVSLANELGVSKTPVREALLQLKRQGLVDIRPRVGTFVFQMSPDQVKQLSELREVLESAAIGFAISRRIKKLTSGMQTIVRHMQLALDMSNVKEYRLLDGEFHQLFFDLCGNDYLMESYSAISFRIQSLRNRLSKEATLNERSLTEHLALLEIVERGDVESARFLLKAHIRGTEDHYLSVMKSESRTQTAHPSMTRA